MENEKVNKHELILQKEIHKYMSEPSRIYKTSSGKRLQIISPGRINPFEGPDFEEIAILLDGYLIIGSAEFHKKSSDWLSHNHSQDIRYKNVILHIVLDYDAQFGSGFETLVLNYTELTEINLRTNFVPQSNIFNTEDLQNLALYRLLRKTSEAKRLLVKLGLKNTLSEMSGDYIGRYEQKRNRHNTTRSGLQSLSKILLNRLHTIFWLSLSPVD